MGTGKTTIGIALAAVLHAEGYRRTLVLSPPHLVYKWRREILETVAGAKVWVLNGPDPLLKLIKLRGQLGVPSPAPAFFVIGLVCIDRTSVVSGKCVSVRLYRGVR